MVIVKKTKNLGDSQMVSFDNGISLSACSIICIEAKAGWHFSEKVKSPSPPPDSLVTLDRLLNLSKL